MLDPIPRHTEYARPYIQTYRVCYTLYQDTQSMLDPISRYTEYARPYIQTYRV